MKKIKYYFLPLMALAFLSSCVSIHVASDYDRQANFKSYQTYAFYKTGIDKAEISDLDKRRILHAIDAEMTYRGFDKSQNPDLLISIFTKEKKDVNVYNNGWGYGWGWGFYNPWMWGPNFYGPSVSTRTQGSLYIDLIDAKTKTLVWQGKGVGTLSNMQSVEKKEERIREFVAEILKEYPPQVLASN